MKSRGSSCVPLGEDKIERGQCCFPDRGEVSMMSEHVWMEIASESEARDMTSPVSLASVLPSEHEARFKSW